MTKNNPIEDLQEIRKMMESSSKFLSLSGLSGVFAGLTALVGAGLTYKVMSSFETNYIINYMSGTHKRAEGALLMNLSLIMIGVLVTAISFGLLFTWLKSKKQGLSLMTPLSFRLMRSLMVPLFFGGCFVLIEAHHGLYVLIGPSTLMFYGLALLNASKYVHVDIKFLAVSEMILGLLSFYFLDFENGDWKSILIFWAIGFGVLHILYGTIMYFRYEYKKD